MRTVTCQVHARRAPFEIKDKLKARGYRWNADERCWWIDVAQEQAEAECAWLIAYSPVIAPKVEKITAWDRHA